VRVLVTGAAGMLGRDLMAHLGDRHEVTGVDLDVDVTDPGAVRACVREHRPEAVFHLAAWTDVDGAEEREADAARVNGGGTGIVAAAAAEAGAALVLPSTDYVFDGAGGPYDEDAEPAPLGAYGRTKLASERAALAAHPLGTRVARTAWLYGAHGRNFVDTMRRLGGERDEVAVVDDQRGSPTYVGHVAEATKQIVHLPYGVYHVAAEGDCTWADFAEAIFEEAGLDTRVRRITTAEFGAKAPRPAYSVLRSEKGAPELPHWRDGLRACLGRLGADS
jgi:dTDP-4-dehydrorhamnose reductase